ncbi:MAG: IS66 family transposase [Eubacteriaceae bacterium]|nr:IS66 family transposase [Eubacteriaceae bacterium]
MWQYRTAPRDTAQIVLFEYKPGRGEKCPEAFLGGYEGLLSTDGYDDCNRLGLLRSICMAHVRRKFMMSARR